MMITKTKQRIKLSKRVKKVTAVLLWPIINALSVWVFTSLAYAERGYSAVGGEWFLILAVMGISSKTAMEIIKEK